MIDVTEMVTRVRNFGMKQIVECLADIESMYVGTYTVCQTMYIKPSYNGSNSSRLEIDKM
jgi:hypothetical protein